jgi:hypothetical protein
VAGVDLDTAVDARAVWTKREMTYVLANSPRLDALDLGGAGGQYAFSDGLTASAEWHSLRARIRLSESATYGQMSFLSTPVLPSSAAPPPAPTPEGQPPPPPPTATIVPQTPQSLLYASSDTSVATTLNLRPWTLSATLGYHVSGGVDSASQAVLPFGQGPAARVSADVQLSARDRDHLSTVVNASEASFSNGAEDVVVGIQAQWRHWWTRRTDTLLGGGWSVTRSRSSADAADEIGNSPNAAAAFNQRFVRGRDSAELHLDVQLTPIINPLTGLVDEQVRATIAGTWNHGKRLRVRAFASLGGSAQQHTTTSVLQAVAEVNTSYIASKWLSWDCGLRGLYQEQDSAGTVPAGGGPTPIVEGTFGQVVAFFGVTWRPVKVKF